VARHIRTAKQRKMVVMILELANIETQTLYFSAKEPRAGPAVTALWTCEGPGDKNAKGIT